MLLGALGTHLYSLVEWVALEKETGEKYEYHEGDLWSVSAMSGGTYAHALMGGNGLGETREAVKRKGADDCHGLSSDIQLKIPRQKK